MIAMSCNMSSHFAVFPSCISIAARLAAPFSRFLQFRKPLRAPAQIDGKDLGTINSPALCQSLLGVYLGKSAVSPDAKENIGSGLAKLIAE